MLKQRNLVVLAAGVFFLGPALSRTAGSSQLSNAPHIKAKRSEVPRTEAGTGSDPGLPSKRRVTVADAIQMNRVAGSSFTRMRYTGASSSDFAVFSPNGRQFVMVLKKGNVEKNTNDYSMLLFLSDKIFDSPVPKTVASFSSSSNREAINSMQWLADNDTVLFLGERPGETTQVYSVRCSSGQITQLTHQTRNVITFSASAYGERIVFGIENPTQDIVDEKTLRDGYHVSSERLADLIAGHMPVCCQQLFFLDAGEGTLRPLHVQGKLWQDPLQLYISPDGQYLVLKTNAATFPTLWSEYTNKDLKELLALKVPKGSPTSYIDRYELIDIPNDSSRYLLDSPAGAFSEVVWSPDSQSVIAAGVFLPLNVQDAAELAARKTQMFTVEIKIPGLDIVTMADHDLKLLGWDLKQQVLRFRKTRDENLSGTADALVYYRKQGSRWETVTSEIVGSASVLPDIRVEQDLNMPPKVVAASSRIRQTAVLFDPNPQFTEIAFGRVEDVSWIGGGGRVVHGGLYLPPDYIAGRHYPLVIQTHGFDRHGFWIDGSFTTGFASQPLAARGVVVLQVPDSHDAIGKPEEARLMVETYEKAIDFLDRRGIVDRSRVGIIGFSRTCFYVKYMLTHSRYRLAVAVVDDGIDGGYFSYLAFPHLDDHYDRLLGAAPFGLGLSTWLKRSPGFLLDKVHTPLRIQANGPESLLEEWHWFAGLSRLSQAVDFVYLPEGDHILEKPWERLVSQQGNVDWLCFWLKGEEDPDPTKIQQYVRWRNLRGLSGANQ